MDTRVGGGDGACVFIVLRKKRQRSGERHEGVAAVTVLGVRR